MVEALHRIDPAVGRHSLAALRAPGVSLLDAVLPLLLNELAALTRPAILVLDDYHMVESQECHLSMSFLVEHLPPPLQLVLSTRWDPPLPLARLRARDELRELHATDLRFTEEEAAVFLNDRPKCSSAQATWPPCTSARKAGLPACSSRRSRSRATQIPAFAWQPSPGAIGT